MKTEKCVFCYENVLKEEIFYEDDLFYARLDRYPGVPGHIEVIPKRHVEYLFGLNAEEKRQMLFSVENTWNKLKETCLKKEYLKMKAINETSKQFIEKALNCFSLEARLFPKDILHGINDGPNAGQSIPHLHWHIIPAFPGKIIKRGIRNAIEDDFDYTQ